MGVDLSEAQPDCERCGNPYALYHEPTNLCLCTVCWEAYEDDHPADLSLDEAIAACAEREQQIVKLNKRERDEELAAIVRLLGPEPRPEPKHIGPYGDRGQVLTVIGCSCRACLEDQFKPHPFLISN